MIKKSITPQDVCDLLNEFLKLDYDCLQAVMSHRELCNKAIATHPTIQVRQHNDNVSQNVGIIGIINGFFGVDNDGMGAICYEIDDGKIIKFKPTLNANKNTEA